MSWTTLFAITVLTIGASLVSSCFSTSHPTRLVIGLAVFGVGIALLSKNDD